jgi:hypothetical protein
MMIHREMIRRNKQIHLNSTRFRQQKKEEEEEEEEDGHTPQTIDARICFLRYWSSMCKGAIWCYNSSSI